MSEIKEISFQVTVDETNLILESLGNMPFSKVYALISKIQEQASRQVSGKKNPSSASTKKQPAIGAKVK